MFTSPRQNDKPKEYIFISQLTAGIDQPEGAQSMMSMLSPRNLIKYVSTAIDDLNSRPKVYKPDPADQHQLLMSFQVYWSKTQPEYKKYTKLKHQKHAHSEKQQRNQQLQFQLKLERIPQSYFDSKYELFFTQKFNKLALKRKQEETAEYLDEIELLLWNKTSKNPDKFFNCIDNFDETIGTVQGGLEKVKRWRRESCEKLRKVNQSQVKIKSLYMKKQRIQQTLSHLQCVKKIKLIKEQSAQSFTTHSCSKQKPLATSKSQVQSKLQILQNIKKKQLQTASKITSLSQIVNNLQFYREQIKQSIYEQFSHEIVELMAKLLAYDKKAWENTKVSPQMLGKQQEKHNNLLEESRLNITILDQSCFGNDNNCNTFSNPTHEDNITHQNLNPNSQTVKTLLFKLNNVWEAIVKYDLYDEEEINQLIMRELIRHNVMWNKDLEEYLTRLFDRFENAEKIAIENMKPILEEDREHQEDEDRSKQISSTQEASQELEQKTQTPKKGNCFSSITQMAGINDIKNLKDLSELKKKTLNTFKRFGNMKKISEALTGASQSTPNLKSQPKDSYCKMSQIQAPQKQQPITKKQQQSKLSLVDTKFFLKAVKFYYQILSSVSKFIHQNRQLVFFQNFLDKLYAFIEERVRFYFSLRHITERTSVGEFLLYLNLIEYWLDVSEDVYESLANLKSTITDEYLTALQKNALVSQLKLSIESSTYLPISITSTHINSFYYVFFWSFLHQARKLQANNMSLTIMKDESKNTLEQPQVDVKSFQHEFKIIGKKIVYKREEFFACDSFVVLVSELEKYLQLREVLVEFNSNIEEKLCQVVGFYVWYNMKHINKTGPNIKPKTLKNLCNIHSTISFLKLIFTQQLKLTNKKYPKTLQQFAQFFKSLDNSIMMTPFYLVEQQISLIYQNSAMTAQFQIPSKETTKILEIIKLSLEELKLHFTKEQIVKILQPTVKVIMKNYFGYLASLGKRGLLEIKEFLPKYKELMLNYGFKRTQENHNRGQDNHNRRKDNHKSGQDNHKREQDNHKRAEQTHQASLKQPTVQTHIFLKQITELEKHFKSKVSQMK